MANQKELLILGAAVASATAGMYFYTDRKRDWNEPLGLKDRNDQPIYINNWLHDSVSP